MDRRQKKTRQAIFQALTNLLVKKSYSNITVQEIIDEADVGRSTFYSHFETKDELLNALCRDIFEHVFEEHLCKESSHDFSSGSRDIREELTHILYHLQDSKRPIRSILSCESGEVFMQYFKNHLTRVMGKAIPDEAYRAPKDYVLNHIVCDFAETVRWWMTHDKYTPEDISGFFLETTPI